MGTPLVPTGPGVIPPTVAAIPKLGFSGGMARLVWCLRACHADRGGRNEKRVHTGVRWRAACTSLDHEWAPLYDESKYLHRETSAAVSLCVTTMATPPRGQCQVEELSPVPADADRSGVLMANNWRHRGNREARSEFAR